MESSNFDMMRANPEWMEENYHRLNQELFGGELGDCDFAIFTTGRGSQGGVLGWFKITNKNVKVDRYTRRLFAKNGFERRYIDKSNFVDVCTPRIELNGNYSGTENSFLDTLVHEMCHYYDYMFGICPKQAHGPSFRNIASMISSRSNGRFSVQRLASAETMSGYKLDQEMQDKRNRRIENKKSRAIAVFVYKEDGQIELTLTSNMDVIKRICQYYGRGNGKVKANEIITSRDPELIEMLYNCGYRKLMRTWRFWYVGDKPWVNTIKNYEYKSEYIKESKSNNKEMIKESKINKIIESVVEDYINNLDVSDDDSIQVGGIDLGEKSPLEYIDN